MTMLDRSSIMVCMNKLTTSKRVQVVAALVEGNSIRSTVRMTGAAKNTVTKLLVELGCACKTYNDEIMRNLPCQRLQVDEIWAFVYAKQKNVPEELQGQEGYGDAWTWTAIDAETKLVPCWMVGGRDAGYAFEFLNDLAKRLAHRCQLTTDAHKAYYYAVEEAFGDAVDYAQLVKMYGAERAGEARYSPAKCLGCRKLVKVGDPDPKHISTSYVERANLTMRLGMRRFTRLTNGFSKKVENLEHAVSLHFMHYNFCRIHQTLKTTPAVAAGITDHVWSLEELIGLLDRETSN